MNCVLAIVLFNLICIIIYYAFSIWGFINCGFTSWNPITDMIYQFKCYFFYQGHFDSSLIQYTGGWFLLMHFVSFIGTISILNGPNCKNCSPGLKFMSLLFTFCCYYYGIYWAASESDKDKKKIDEKEQSYIYKEIYKNEDDKINSSITRIIYFMVWSLIGIGLMSISSCSNEEKYKNIKKQKNKKTKKQKKIKIKKNENLN